MMAADYLIVGAGIAGTTAAQTIRSIDPDGSIVLVGDEPHPLYSRVLLPFVVDGKIPGEKAFLKNESWYREQKIEYLRGRRVARLNGAEHRAVLEDGSTIIFRKALVATGGHSRRMDVPGERLKGIHRLQNMADAQGVMNAIGKKGAVIGGGFISFEFVNSFIPRKTETTLAIRRSRVLERALAPEASAIIERHLESHGVRILKEVVPLAFEGDERVSAVKFSNNETVEADTVGVGIGLEPCTHFLEDVEKNRAGIPTNEYLETSAADVYAAGDVAEFFDQLIGKRHVLGNWQNAQEQGKIAGMNMAGKRTEYRKVTQFSMNVLGLNIAFIGDAYPSGEYISRGDGTSSFATLNVRDGKVIGAALVNCVPDRAPVMSLIERGTDISNLVADLSRPEFNVREIVS